MKTHATKRLFSLFLTLALCFMLSAPALATNVQSSFTSAETYYGYTFTEELLENGDFVITSYYQGNAQKQYTIKENHANIYVQNLNSRTTNSNYTIPKAVAVPRETSAVYSSNRWATAGDIYYNNHSSLGSVRATLMAYGTTADHDMFLDVRANTLFDDAVASVSAFLLGEGLASWAIALGFSGVTALAAAYLSGVIASLAINVVSGIIKTAFAETLYMDVVEWDFRATPIRSNSVGTSVILENTGTSFYMYLPDTSEWESDHQNYTLYEWGNKPNFARAVWEAMYPSYTYPGVTRYAPVFN